MIVVTEFLGGGELFERVASEDYNLTELDCTSFLRYLIIQRYILFFPMINTYSLEMGIRAIQCIMYTVHYYHYI